MKHTIFPKTWVEISRKNLLHNLGEFKKLSRGASIMAVIKANAYGHGLKEVASILKDYPKIMFGVDSPDEAIVARAVAPKKEVMILGYIPKENIIDAAKNNFHFSAYDKETIGLAASVAKKIGAKKLRVHLKIETGTNRLGIGPGELKSLKLPNIEGIYTHLAESENPNSSFYKKQVAELDLAGRILKEKGMMPRFVHASCTAAIAQYGPLGGNLVRLGIGLYGLWPAERLRKKFSKRINLKPVISWKTKLAQVKRVLPGETIGYDRTHKIKNQTNIGVLPVGYFDGYDRRLSDCGEVLIGGRKFKIAGRVCMNMAMVDLGRFSPRREAEAVLIGKQGKEEISADDIAEKIGTINYEIVSRINPLLPRVIK